MATFNETISGGAAIMGCAVITFFDRLITLFAAGDIVFNIDKARKGVMERIVIKKIKVINASLIGGQTEVMYVDTLNALWNEVDLIDYDDALALATAYYEALLAEAAVLPRC